MVLVQVNNVSKKLDATDILTQISFTIEKGQVIGLLGPNGVGKTTLLQLITHSLHPDEGQVIHMDGLTIALKMDRLLYPLNMRVEDYLRTVAQLSGIKNAHIETAVVRSLSMIGLSGAARKKIGACSHGMRQRLGIAQCLIGEPDLILLDEPINGLDPGEQARMLALIQKLGNEGRTLLISTHRLHQIEQVCTHILILREGRISVQGDLKSLLQSDNSLHEIYMNTRHIPQSVE